MTTPEEQYVQLQEVASKCALVLADNIPAEIRSAVETLKLLAEFSIREFKSRDAEINKLNNEIHSLYESLKVARSNASLAYYELAVARAKK